MTHEANTCPDEGVDPFLELDQLRMLFNEGEVDLATLRAIGLGSALHDLRVGGEAAAAALEAEVLSDLSALRQARDDLSGARALARACLELSPGHALATANLAALEALPLPVPEDRSNVPFANKLNTWVRAGIDRAQKQVGFAGKSVIEIGGAVPEEHARATGASSWSCFYLGAEPSCTPGYEVRNADARAIPWPDQSFDMAFSCCAFEHIRDLPVALREIARVLRPGGVLATSFAPIWSSAVGHHLWGRLDDGSLAQFNDPIVPLFGHLLLSERELRWFLQRTLGLRAGARFSDLVFHNPHINRVFESQFREYFAAAGFDDSELRPQGPWKPIHEPSPALLDLLETRHPGMGTFRTVGFEGHLSLGVRRGPLPAAPARTGRTIFFGLHT